MVQQTFWCCCSASLPRRQPCFSLSHLQGHLDCPRRWREGVSLLPHASQRRQQVLVLALVQEPEQEQEQELELELVLVQKAAAWALFQLIGFA